MSAFIVQTFQYSLMLGILMALVVYPVLVLILFFHRPRRAFTPRRTAARREIERD